MPFVNGNTNPGPDFDFGGYYATCNYDVGHLSISHGMVISVDPDDTITEEGTFYRWDDAIVDGDYGITVDHVPLDDNVLVVYVPRITPIVDPTDTIELWLDWQVKYIERKTMALAFLCNNNRYNPDMSAFWEMRYQAGLKVLARYKAKRTAARRVKLKSAGYLPARQIKGLVDLPDDYPSAWR